MRSGAGGGCAFARHGHVRSDDPGAALKRARRLTPRCNCQPKSLTRPSGEAAPIGSEKIYLSVFISVSPQTCQT
eukprot:scaffold21899_cov63-Phaeocystis_antarctica.AAC.9